MLKNYLKVAFRNLWKNKVYSFVNVVGLAIGMATCVLLVLWVQNEWSYDNYHKKAGNIYRVNSIINNDSKDWKWNSVPYLLANQLSTLPEIKETTRLYIPYLDAFSVRVAGELRDEKAFVFVDSNWFEIFDYSFVQGNALAFAKDKYALAITETRARQWFGDENALGKTIAHDSLQFTVRAVLKDIPANSIFRFQVIAHNDAALSSPVFRENKYDWSNFDYQTFVVCKNEIELPKTSARVSAIFKKIRARKEENVRLEMQPLSAIHLDTSVVSDSRMPVGDKTSLYIFSIVAVFILIIACINYVNLTTAQASVRSKEVSVKKIIGASRSILFWQFFAESVITSLLAMVLSVYLLLTGLPVLNSLADNHFSLESAVVWPILGGITLVATLLTGIYPSVLLSSFDPIRLLKGIAFGKARNATLQKTLVVFQFTFTLVLLISTFLVFRQLQFISTKKLGYAKEHVYALTIPWNVENSEVVKQSLMHKLAQESSILAVTASNMNIIDMQSAHSGSLDWEGRKPDWQPTVSQFSVQSDFKDFFKLKMADGRWFQETNKADDNHVILNETAVKELGILQPVVGQRFEFQGRKGQIIGVAKDFHFKSPREKIEPLVIFRNNNWLSTIYIKAAPQQLDKALAVTAQVWEKLIPGLVFKYEFLDDTYAHLHQKEQKQLVMFNAFAGIVLLLSCFGLFALATFAAERRIKEVGIRKVLGASIGQIVALLSSDFLKLVVIAFAIAVPIAWYAMHEWLQQFAYRIEIRWWIFAAAGLVALLVALLTVSFQAIKAALANPVRSLRSE